jgi:hypothetical protein
MTGGLINIISYGANDMYLTGDPQITFFKIVYRRHTNFAKESVEITLDDLQFGSNQQISLPKYGDLINEVYLQIQIPETYFTKTELDLTANSTTIGTQQSDYNIILSFMQYNVEAYNILYNDYIADNVTVITMVQDVLALLGSTPAIFTVETQYKNLLSSSFASVGYYYLNYKFSDLFFMCSNWNTILTIDPTAYSKTDIMGFGNSALLYSQKVQEYYRQILLTYTDSQTYVTNAKFAWIERLGHFIVDYIDVFIGGEKIDRHYGEWINLFYELAGNKKQEQMYFKMIGNVSTMTSYDRNPKPLYVLRIPLRFWFCRKAGLALPMIALEYSTFNLDIKLKSLTDCCYVEHDTPPPTEPAVQISDAWENKGYYLQCSLWVDYVFLDALERKRFAQSAHEYLVEKVQEFSIYDVVEKRNEIRMDFVNPCKELMFFVQKTEYVNNTTNWYNSMWWNYSINKTGTGQSIDNASLLLNGYELAPKELGNYYNYVIPWARHSNTPSDGIYVYSFSAFPEEHQPSSTCNFSKLDSPVLSFYVNNSMFTYKLSDIDPNITAGSPSDLTLDTSVRIRIFAITYNILRIIGGMGALAYY